jgi:hypothetical protein
LRFARDTSHADIPDQFLKPTATALGKTSPNETNAFVAPVTSRGTAFADAQAYTLGRRLGLYLTVIAGEYSLLDIAVDLNITQISGGVCM